MQRPILPLVLFFALAACHNPSEKVIYHSIRSPEYDSVFQPALLPGAQPAIFEKAFSPGTTDTAEGKTLRFSAEQWGAIKIESGKIVACDPIQVSDSPPFGAVFPTGSFPVQAAIAAFQKDHRVAYVRILFSIKPVAKWEMAVPAGHKPLAVFDSTFYGYGVDGGLGMFIDSLAQHDLASMMKKDDQLWQDIFVDGIDKNVTLTCAHILYPFHDHNLIVCSSGLGDGRYASYIGYDSTGQICRLLTDFDLVDWFHRR